jgi:hypothetical protein
MFEWLFRKQMFPNLSSFTIALALFAFNVFIVCLLLLLRAIHAIPDPFTHLTGVASLEDARGLLIVTAMWSIGNTLILLGMIDAVRQEPDDKTGS